MAKAMNIDLQAAMARHSAGETWREIAASLGITYGAMWVKLQRAGYDTSRKGQAAKPAKPAIPASATPAPAATPNPFPAEAAEVISAAKEEAEVRVEPKQKKQTFVTPEWYRLMRYAIKNRKGATLFGPRGSGKSTAIRHLAHELKATTVTMQCAGNMQIDSFLGSWTSEAGTLKFVDGPLAIAVRNGGWLLAEEANVVHPGVWSIVNTLTDATGEGLRLPSGEVIPPHPNFRLVLLYNDGYTGTREINSALKDRLMPVYCDYLPKAQEIDLIVSMTGIDRTTAGQIRGVAEMVRAANLRFDLSPRALANWVGLVVEEKLTWKQAYVHAIMDLVGPPQLAGPQRAVLEEIAKNTCWQWT